MQRAEFYEQIDDWVAYNFNLLGANSPNATFKHMFLTFIEAELGRSGITDADQMMPWKMVNDRKELDNLLPNMFTEYLNKRYV